MRVFEYNELNLTLGKARLTVTLVDFFFFFFFLVNFCLPYKIHCKQSKLTRDMWSNNIWLFDAHELLIYVGVYHQGHTLCKTKAVFGWAAHLFPTSKCRFCVLLFSVLCGQTDLKKFSSSYITIFYSVHGTDRQILEILLLTNHFNWHWSTQFK